MAEHFLTAQGTIAARRLLVDNFPDVIFRRLLASLLDRAARVIDANAGGDEIQRLRVNFSTIATRLLEAGMPELTSVGLQYWQRRLFRIEVDDADCDWVTGLTKMVRSCTAITIVEQNDELRDRALALLATERARRVLVEIGLGDYCERVRLLETHPLFMMDVRDVTIDGLSDLLGERVYVRVLRPGDTRLLQRFDPVPYPDPDPVIAAYQREADGTKALLRTAVHEMVHNVTRVQRVGGPLRPSGSLRGVNFATRDGDGDGSSWTEAGFAFERLFFGLRVPDHALCPFSVRNMNPITTPTLR